MIDVLILDTNTKYCVSPLTAWFSEGGFDKAPNFLEMAQRKGQKNLRYT